MKKMIPHAAISTLLCAAILGACGFTNYKDPTNPSSAGTFTEVNAIARAKCLSCTHQEIPISLPIPDPMPLQKRTIALVLGIATCWSAWSFGTQEKFKIPFDRGSGSV